MGGKGALDVNKKHWFSEPTCLRTWPAHLWKCGPSSGRGKLWQDHRLYTKCWGPARLGLWRSLEVSRCKDPAGFPSPFVPAVSVWIVPAVGNPSRSHGKIDELFGVLIGNRRRVNCFLKLQDCGRTGKTWLVFDNRSSKKSNNEVYLKNSPKDPKLRTQYYTVNWPTHEVSEASEVHLAFWSCYYTGNKVFLINLYRILQTT